VTDLSVIICTRNPRPAYLGRVLESLRQQTLGKNHWELLIIDNASDKNLADDWDLSWHPSARHVREETLGVMPARLRGLSESIGHLLVFVDDDTILAAEYLSLALALSARHPQLGAFGTGTLEPEFEVTLPAELVTRAHLLGLRTIDSTRWSNNPSDCSCRPWGAGLCVTPEVAMAYAGLASRLGLNHVVGRRGQRLFAGEDDLFAWAASSVGKWFGLFPELRVTHLIPTERTKHDYFVRLIHDHSFSHSLLRYMLIGARPQRLGLSKLPRLLAHGLKKGKFSLQCHYAQLHGEDDAWRFIEQGQLRPLRQTVPVILALAIYLTQAWHLDLLP
jgi:glycosyltransferase involved in cell wall biosynthesis